VLHYHNYYEDVYTDVIREGDAIIFDGNKYLMLNDIRQSQYSRIILSESNKTDLDYRGEYIEWDYEIENPVHGNKLKVLEAPGWCGGIDGVTVSDDKISFYADSTKISTEGKFRLSYRTADDLEIKVNQLTPYQISLQYTSRKVGYSGATLWIKYSISNSSGLKHTVTTDVKWIRVYADAGGYLHCEVDKNYTEERTGKITVTCGITSVSCTIIQEAGPFSGSI
jgi:hypothetical protein